MQINSFILSLFWVEIHLGLLENVQPKNAQMKFLGRAKDYAEKFDESQHFLRLNTPLPLSPPWAPRTKGQNFWTYYTGGMTNANVSGSTAWKKLVPFLSSPPLGLITGKLISSPLIEIFFYPHGIACGITLTWKAKRSRSLDDATTAAFNARFNHQSRAIWNGLAGSIYDPIIWPEKSDTPLSLDMLGDHCLCIARTLAYNQNEQPGIMTKPEPFSLITVLSGQDIDLSKTIDDNGAIQKTLHALTNWQKIREGAAPLTFDDKVQIELGEEAGDADILYGQRRGRAVWYPSRFTAIDPKILYALECFHRNLFFASLQTESLCGFAHCLIDRLKNNIALSVHQRELASKTAGNLGLLFGGHPDTYRSLSPCRQIQDNGWVDDINALRAYRGMTPLF